MTLASRIHRRLMHEMAKNEPRNVKVRERMIKRIKRHCWHAFEGYSINTPRVGDILIHIRTSKGRKSISIDAGGYMRWHTPVVFTHELMEAA